jgi:hypothetical protein
MADEKPSERWMTLCEQAANEKDPAKLLALVTEINRLFDEMDTRRLKAKHASKGN